MSDLASLANALARPTPMRSAEQQQKAAQLNKELPMPFPKQDGSPFTKANIEALRPNQIGVYGIYRADVWIYVGSGDIRTRLLSHANGDNPRIMKERPTGYVTWVTGNADEIEKALILELNPIANRKVG